MKPRIEWSEQVSDFVKSLAPEPRQRVRKALHALEDGHGDTKALHGQLEGYYRLRTGHYRIIYRETVERGKRVIKCIYGAPRNVVYEIFSTMRLDSLDSQN